MKGQRQIWAWEDECWKKISDSAPFEKACQLARMAARPFESCHVFMLRAEPTAQRGPLETALTCSPIRLQRGKPCTLNLEV